MLVFNSEQNLGEQMASIITSFLFPTKISSTMSTFSNLNLLLPKTLIFKFSVRIIGNLSSSCKVLEI